MYGCDSVCNSINLSFNEVDINVFETNFMLSHFVYRNFEVS